MSNNEGPKTSAVVLGAVILGAGRSARMGRPKLLLPWGSSSIIGHLVQQWRGLDAKQVAVVCAAGDQAMASELARLGFPDENRIYNPAPERGMFSSIQCAAQWSGWEPNLTHWAIILGDQPHLQEDTLRQVLALSAREPTKVCQPAYRGKPRHPVVLPEATFRKLAVSKAATLKEFLAGCEIQTLESEDAGMELDIDRPEDYQRAHFFTEGNEGNEGNEGISSRTTPET